MLRSLLLSVFLMSSLAHALPSSNQGPSDATINGKARMLNVDLFGLDFAPDAKVEKVMLDLAGILMTCRTPLKQQPDLQKAVDLALNKLKGRFQKAKILHKQKWLKIAGLRKIVEATQQARIKLDAATSIRINELVKYIANQYQSELDAMQFGSGVNPIKNKRRAEETFGKDLKDLTLLYRSMSDIEWIKNQVHLSKLPTRNDVRNKVSIIQDRLRSHGLPADVKLQDPLNPTF